MPDKQTDKTKEYGLKATDLMYLIYLPTEEWGKLTEAEKREFKQHKEYMRACLIQKICSENWEAQQRWESTHRGSRYLEGPLYQRIARVTLEELYHSYQTGEKQALLEAMYGCMMHAIPFPRWCKKAFLSACREVYTYKAKAWDDVFERPHPKGTHLGAKRQEREKSLQVCRRIQQIKKDDPLRAIDGDLFETVGKEFGIGGKTKTEEWYYKHKDEV